MYSLSHNCKFEAQIKKRPRSCQEASKKSVASVKNLQGRYGLILEASRKLTSEIYQNKILLNCLWRKSNWGAPILNITINIAISCAYTYVPQFVFAEQQNFVAKCECTKKKSQIFSRNLH